MASIRTFGMALLLSTLLVSIPGHARRKPRGFVDAAMNKIEDSLVKPPADNEVCFSPDEPCDVKLWKFIQTAKKTLDVAVYDVNEPKIVHEILVASKRLPVRVLVDRRQSHGEHSLVGLLVKAGASVRFGKQRGIMHNKFTIVDGDRLETGSFNYTNHASQANNENQVYLSTPAIVERYKKRFDEIWAEGAPVAPGDVAAKD